MLIEQSVMESYFIQYMNIPADMIKGDQSGIQVIEYFNFD